MTSSHPSNRARGITVMIVAGAMAVGTAVAPPSSVFADPPPNDDFPGTTIASLPFTDTVDASGAADEPGEPFCSANEGLAVWYSFTPPADTTLLADAAGSDYPVFISA